MAEYPHNPWTPIDESGYTPIRIHAANGQEVAIVQPTWNPEDTVARARLISAAPELLDACKSVREALGTPYMTVHEASDLLRHITASFAHKLDAAIAKAEGGAA